MSDSACFKRYIQLVGKGKSTSRSLTKEEAYDAMSMILDGKVSDLQLGAFLMLLRVKEETPEEIAGFVQAVRDSLKSKLGNFTNLYSKSIDIGCYAGKRRQLPYFILAIAILVENGFKVFLHGNDEPDTKRLYVSTVLEEFGLGSQLTANSFSDATQCLENYSMTYMSLKDIHRPLYELIQLRKEFGLRSCANTIARITNPSGSKYSIQGVHHLHFDHKHMNVAKRLNDTNVMCFRGEGGEPEINPAKDSQIHVIRANNAQIDTTELEAKQGWQIKPKSLENTKLLKLWDQKETMVDSDPEKQWNYAMSNKELSYGTLSVVQTLTAYYQLVLSLDQKQAFEQAKTDWFKRDTERLFNLRLNSPKLKIVRAT